MNSYGTSTVIDLGENAADGGAGAAAAGSSGGSAGGGDHNHSGDCCGGHSHGQQKKISLDVMEEGREVEYLFEAVKAGYVLMEFRFCRSFLSDF